MNIQHVPAKVAGGRPVGWDDMRSRERWIVLARGLWLVLVILTVALFCASLPDYLTQLQTPCTRTSCEFQQLTEIQVQTLLSLGFSLGGYATVTLVFALITLAINLVVSALIIWRRPGDRMAFIVALALITVGTILISADMPTASPWKVPNLCLTLLSQNLQALVFLLFPGGQFVPRWMRWIFVIFLVAGVPALFLPNAPLIPNNPATYLGWFMALSELALAAVVQVYRYLRVSNPLQRQQTKWVVLGFALPILIDALGSLLPLLFPALAESGSFFPLLFNEISFLLPIGIPLSFGFAMLRYRLWDIDSLINRTLVYALLTVILAALYIGLIIGLQTLLHGIISQDNGAAIVISTLAIAALFQPLRRRLQALIDRRFYRQKYDAEKALAAFSAILRNEVDLEHIREQLLAVVQETMQPTAVSLWLYQPRQRKPYGEDF